MNSRIELLSPRTILMFLALKIFVALATRLAMLALRALLLAVAINSIMFVTATGWRISYGWAFVLCMLLGWGSRSRMKNWQFVKLRPASRARGAPGETSNGTIELDSSDYRKVNG